MKNLDKFIIGLMLITGIWLLMSNNNNDNTKVSPHELQQKLIQRTRFYTTEDVAKAIISKDPSLQLIDIRTADEYNKFTLKGAINIPLKDLLKKENLDYFDQDVYNTVIFSNGSSNSDVAWMILTRLGYKNIYIMDGGLNAWVDNILRPKYNPIVWDRKQEDLYEFRKGASFYFGGGSTVSSGNEQASKPKKKLIKRKKKEVTGGCG